MYDFKTNTSYFIKKNSAGMHPKPHAGYQYIFASKQINMFIEWIVKIQYLSWMLNTIIISFQTKYTPGNKFILFIFRVCKFWRGEKKTKIQQMPP